MEHWHRSGQVLLNEISTTRLPASQLAVWSIGQCGFIFKYEDTVVCIDPVLSDLTGPSGSRRCYPAPFAPNPSAPTAAALAPLELAAEHVGVPEDMPYTPKLLAATFMGSFDKDPADRFPALLDGRDSTLVTERAIAAAVPEEFVTALVSKTLGELPIL